MPRSRRPRFRDVIRMAGEGERVDAKMYGWWIASPSGSVPGCQELARLVSPELVANNPSDTATFRLTIPSEDGRRLQVDAFTRSAWMICTRAIDAGDATPQSAAKAMNMVGRGIVRLEDFFRNLVGENDLAENGMPSISVASRHESEGSWEVPRDAILAVAENGLTEAEAEEAIEEALSRGELRRSALTNADSSLYRPCDERRFMMNRILNSLAMKRAEARSSAEREESGPGDPLVDVTTGRPAGV